MIRLNTETYRSGHNGTDSKSESLRGTLHPKKSLSSPHQFSPFSKADWVKIQLGGLSEWSKVRLSKSRVPQGT